MAFKSLGVLDLSNPDLAKTWLMAFGALARSKKWTDTDPIEATEEEAGSDAIYSITDNFMALCGLSSLNKVQFIVAPRQVQAMKFVDIEEALTTYLKPKEKLTIAERTRFYGTKQQADESVMDFAVRLRKAVEFCDFDQLKTSNDPTEEMVLVALVAGLHSSHQQEKVLEKMHTMNMSVAKVQEFVLRLEQVQSFIMGNNNRVTKLAENDTLDGVATEVHYHQRPGNTSNASNGGAKLKLVSNCKFCGQSHAIRQCPAFGKSCSFCGKNNHFAIVCRLKKRSVHAISDYEPPEDILHTSGNSAKTKMMRINDCNIPMQIDTGSSISIISSNIWQQLGRPQLRRCDRRLEAYDGHIIPTLGKFTATIDFDNRYSLCDFVVVEVDKTFGLIGRDLLDMEQVHSTALSSTPTILPAMKGVKARMDLVDGAPNVFCRARPVPIALEAAVNRELTRLESLGVITPIEGGAVNASPVVWVKKPNGQLRLCVDFKAHVNAKIKTEPYPTPSTEMLFARLKNATRFAKLDLTSAYWQIELDDAAKELSIINTTKGLYRVNRLQMGMKNSSAIFQRAMESALGDLKGVLIYQDDVLIHASNDDELRKRLQAVKTRLHEKHITVNTDKSVEYADEISFLGFRISSKGITPDAKLVDKVKQIQTPINKREVEQFMGLVNFFGRLIDNFASKVLPINRLRQRDVPFMWSAKCAAAFDLIKKEITSFPVVQPYCLDKEVTLTTDASQSALGACLTQDGHPVIYVSRVLSPAEKNYSNIEREALSITWAVLRLKHFLLGRHFSIRTDHKPLVHLLGRHTAVPCGTSARICRWALMLMPYDYDIDFVQGVDIPHADAMSRLSFAKTVPTKEDAIATDATINSIDYEQQLLDPNQVKLELAVDSFANRIMNRVRSGNWIKCSQAETPYRLVAEKLTIEDGMLYAGTKLFIPSRLRQAVFNICHEENHSGIHSSIQRIRLSAWWPGMDKDIQLMVEKCGICRKLRPSVSKAVDVWPAARPFQRLHMDWAHVNGVGDVLIIVDAGSGWIEAFPMRDRSSNSVIRCLRTVYTRFGVAEALVSDNAKEFVSQEVNTWLHLQGTKKLESPPYFPRANGLAERAVQTVKNGLKAWKETCAHMGFVAYLQKVLLHHRIATSARGKSPAEIVFGRQLRVPIMTNFQQGDNIWLKQHSEAALQPATYLMTGGKNTSWLLKNERLTFASNNQIAPAGVPVVTLKPERDLPAETRKSEQDLSPAQGIDGFPKDDLREMEQQTLERQDPPKDPTQEPTMPESPQVRRSDRVRQRPQRYGFD